MTQQERHAAIVELVKRQGYASIEQLARDFDVTPQTVRREFERMGI